MTKKYFITEHQIEQLKLVASRTRLVMIDLLSMIGDIVKQELKETENVKET